MKKNPVVHFEMPAQDLKRVNTFYTDTFGWDMNQLGNDMGNYLLSNSADVDENGMAKTPGAINGGFYKSEKAEPPHFVISVDNLEQHMKTVTENGGTIIDKPMDIPGIGTFVMIKDTEGNKVGMLQPVSM